MTEREKMIAGELYNPADPELVKLRHKAHRLCTQFNQTFQTAHGVKKPVLSHYARLPFRSLSSYGGAL